MILPPELTLKIWVINFYGKQIIFAAYNKHHAMKWIDKIIKGEYP